MTLVGSPSFLLERFDGARTRKGNLRSCSKPHAITRFEIFGMHSPPLPRHLHSGTRTRPHPLIRTPISRNATGDAFAIAFARLHPVRFGGASLRQAGEKSLAATHPCFGGPPKVDRLQIHSMQLLRGVLFLPGQLPRSHFPCKFRFRFLCIHYRNRGDIHNLLDLCSTL